MNETFNQVAIRHAKELTAANERIADLERKLACARAEVVSEALSICIRLSARLSQGAGYAISFVEEELRSIALAPSGYVCVRVDVIRCANALVKAAYRMRQAANDLWLAHNPEEANSPGMALSVEDAQEAHSDAFKSLESAEYYMSKAMLATARGES